eukprot:1401011-Amphidinium_carterae.1
MSMHDDRHSRIPGECLHPDVEAIRFDCPACQQHKPRWSDGHTYELGVCRWASAQDRNRHRKNHRQPRPARVPEHTEPTARLAAPEQLGNADEAQAAALERQLLEEQGMEYNEGELQPQEELPPLAPIDEASVPGPAPLPPPPEPPAAQPPARRGRGPDRQPRHAPARARDQAAGPATTKDWTSFDVHSSLRGLRLADEAGRRRILRKLHLRWWHSSAGAMVKILKAAGIGDDVLKLLPSIVDTCAACRQWTRPSPEAIPSVQLATSFNIEVEGDLLFIQSADGTDHVV